MNKSNEQPTLPNASQPRSSVPVTEKKVRTKRNKRSGKKKESSDVLISAVISTYLLTHLHHVLQRAEDRAAKEGRVLQAENFSQLRKVLCMDARSMKDASATGMTEVDVEQAA